MRFHAIKKLSFKLHKKNIQIFVIKFKVQMIVCTFNKFILQFIVNYAKIKDIFTKIVRLINELFEYLKLKANIGTI